MGFIKNYIEKREVTNPRNPAYWLGLSGNKTSSGVSVTITTAMRVSAVYACVNVLAGTFACVPWVTYKRLEKGKDRATKHNLYNKLHMRPNPYQSSSVFRSAAMAHALLHGNAYAEIEFDSAGLPVALWQLPPWRVKLLCTGKQEPFYQVTLPDGHQQNLPPYRMWHLMGLSTDGMTGMSVIGQGRETIGLSIATQSFGADYFANGTNTGGFIELPHALTKERGDSFKEDLRDKYAGMGKTHRLMLLEEGMKYTKIGIPPNDSQFIESMQFLIEDVARMFHVPLHMIGHLLRSTNNNIEHQGIEYVVHTMNPWFVNCEQETNYKLFGDSGEYFSEFLVDGLLRGDSAARSAFYNAMFQMGAFSPNMILEKENMNPVEGGDEHFVPLNMVPIKDAGFVNAPQPQQNALPAVTETRTKKQGALHRQRVAKSYRSVFEDAAQQVVKKEVDNVRRAAKKYLGERSIDQWQTWLNDFYRDFPEQVISKKMGPAFMSLADAIKFIAASEVNIKEPSVDNFVKAYSDTFVSRYVDSSKGQLEALVRDAAAAKADPLSEIDGRLDEWEQKRAGKVGMNETVQLANAIAKVVFVAAGIRYLIWSAQGSDSCPFCQDLDGKKVGIENDFNTKGLDSAGHPPIHEGCECQIVPG
jgi:HK97 family phage portal protein